MRINAGTVAQFESFCSSRLGSEDTPWSKFGRHNWPWASSWSMDYPRCHSWSRPVTVYSRSWNWI